VQTAKKTRRRRAGAVGILHDRLIADTAIGEIERRTDGYARSIFLPTHDVRFAKPAAVGEKAFVAADAAVLREPARPPLSGQPVGPRSCQTKGTATHPGREERMDQRTFIFAVIVLVVLILAAAAGLMIWQPWGMIRPQAARSDNLPTVGPKDFSDGIGIYYLNDGKYNFLIWRTKLLTSEAAPPAEKDMLAVAEQAIRVKKGVRFYSYGLEFSKWGFVPPYAMGFCVARDVKTIDGVFPIRIKPVDSPGQIYELVPPPFIDDLSSGKMQYLFWAINFQYSCNEGWVFKFP
jgi:hypothetical protein